MRVLFVVGHPAHVHLFRNPIRTMDGEGHDIMIGCIEKEITKSLLSHYGLPHVSIGASQKDLITKTLDVVRKDFRTIQLLRDFKPDIVVSTGIPYASHAASLAGIPSIAFSDTEIATLVLKSTLPFVSAICTPSCFGLDLGSKHIRYNGYHELAYLHPRYFEPDKSVLDEVDLQAGDPFFITRFSSLDSSHDMGWRGTSVWRGDTVRRFLHDLEEYGHVFVMSEIPLDRDLEKYVLRIPYHRSLDMLALARLYIGEGATMASEAGVLGVPWIFTSLTDRGYLNDQEQRYGLGYQFTDTERAREKAIELLEDPKLREKWKSRREKLLEEKVDVTRFIVDFVLGWPRSFERMKVAGSL